jgi:hypothetical protein
LRAHTQTTCLQPGYAPPTRADGVDVDNRHEDRESPQVGFAGHVGHPIHHQADVEACATHVDADEVALVENLAQRRRADDSADRSRKDCLDGVTLGSRGGHDATVGLHNMQRFPKATGMDLVLHAVQVALDDGGDVGVDDRRAGALVLAPLTRYPVGQGDGHTRQPAPEDLPNQQLVDRVGVGMQQADRH